MINLLGLVMGRVINVIAVYCLFLVVFSLLGVQVGVTIVRNRLSVTVGL